MTSKLTVYNNAILLCGQDMLAALTDDNKARRLCDQFYEDAIDEILESAAWKFAMRSIQLSPDPDINVEFGYLYGFTRPEDWCRTYIVSASPTFDPPLNEFNDEAEDWFADVNPLYVRHVSNDVAYGYDLSLWTRKFANAVEARLAEKIVPTLVESENKLDRIAAQSKDALREAKSADAFREGVKLPPQGRWTSSRRGTGRFTRTPGGYTYA